MKSLISRATGLTGTRIRLEEYDFKPDVRSLFPREGRIVRQLEALNGVKDWYLLELDEPFDFRGTRHTQVVIRTRRTDIRLGEEDPTSAYVLLIRDPAALEEKPFDVKKFDHVGNGMAIALLPNAPKVVEQRDQETYQRCKHCGKKVNSEVTHCPGCGERLRRSLKPELVLAAQTGIGLIILMAVAAVIVKTDPTMPYSVKTSSLWYKAPIGILAAIGLWFVIDLVMDRFSSRR